MPTWTHSLQIITLIAAGGFGLLIISQYGLLLAGLLVLAGVPFWIRRRK